MVNAEVTEHYDCSNQTDISRILISDLIISCSQLHDVVNNGHQKGSHIWKERTRFTSIEVKSHANQATCHPEIVIL